MSVHPTNLFSYLCTLFSVLRLTEVVHAFCWLLLYGQEFTWLAQYRSLRRGAMICRVIGSNLRRHLEGGIYVGLCIPTVLRDGHHVHTYIQLQEKSHISQHAKSDAEGSAFAFPPMFSLSLEASTRKYPTYIIVVLHTDTSLQGWVYRVWMFQDPSLSLAHATNDPLAGSP